LEERGDFPVNLFSDFVAILPISRFHGARESLNGFTRGMKRTVGLGALDFKNHYANANERLFDEDGTDQINSLFRIHNWTSIISVGIDSSGYVLGESRTKQVGTCPDKC
jgi:hypothetical protein